MKTLPLFGSQIPIDERYSPASTRVLCQGDVNAFLQTIPDETVRLIITSPPYNLGKAYENRVAIEEYLHHQAGTIAELVRVLASDGSICWQVGNFVENGEVFPLDILYYPIFKNLGLPNRGKPSGNPMGKNPSDVWEVVLQDWEECFWEIPNVKSNHPEKTIHPCQFPIELVERCVLALTHEGDWVFDPYAGVGSALIAAAKHSRRAMGCEKEADYTDIARERIIDFYQKSAVKPPPSGVGI